jgi:mannose-6-phosphate isomerase-like protein (cupin superfamily)
MKHVFPLGQLAAGQWLFGGPEAECGIRGCTAARSAEPFDRLLVLLRGSLALDGRTEEAAAGSLAWFVPAGVECSVEPDDGATCVEVRVPASPRESAAAVKRLPLVAQGLQGTGFAWKSLVDRAAGSVGLRANLVHVQPGAGSPDRHIHAFDQFYVILEGTMRVEVGRTALDASAPSLVVLPAGCVHRNWNASAQPELHVALLVPEPADGEIFDYAVEIHDREATLMEAR